jgi:hypothetical protein
MLGRMIIAIVDKRAVPTAKQIRVTDIPISTTFTGTIGNTTGLFLRTFSSVVNLRDPGSTWNILEPGLACSFAATVVKDYNPVAVELTITGNA